MDLSVVMVNRNTTSYLQSSIGSLKKSLGENIKYEVIVVDNHSNKKNSNSLKTIKGIKRIFLSKNVGFGAANNIGVKKARGTYILLLNPDTEIINGSIGKLLIFIKKHSFSFVGPRLLNKDSSTQRSCGSFYTLRTVILLLFLKGEDRGITKFSPNKSCKVDWLSAACMIFPKEDFIALGGFDEDKFLYDEDVDLLYRARKKGLLCYFYKDASIIHIGAVSTKGENSVVNTFEGLAYFYNKHYSYIDQIILKFLLVIKFIISICLFTLTGNVQKAASYQKAARKTLFSL